MLGIGILIFMVVQGSAPADLTVENLNDIPERVFAPVEDIPTVATITQIYDCAKRPEYIEDTATVGMLPPIYVYAKRPENNNKRYTQNIYLSLAGPFYKYAALFATVVLGFCGGIVANSNEGR